MSIIKEVRKNPKRHVRREPLYDFLKYWRVVRFWALKRYDLSLSDLELLLYLYSCPLFSRGDFKVFNDLVSWDKDRFDRLQREGWVMMWRNKKKGSKALYQVSFKTKNMITGIYRKLLGEEPISEDRRANPIFQDSKTGVMDKMYRRGIKHMNEENKAKRKQEKITTSL